MAKILGGLNGNILGWFGKKNLGVGCKILRVKWSNQNGMGW